MRPGSESSEDQQAPARLTGTQPFQRLVDLLEAKPVRDLLRELQPALAIELQVPRDVHVRLGGHAMDAGDAPTEMKRERIDGDGLVMDGDSCQDGPSGIAGETVGELA